MALEEPNIEEYTKSLVKYTERLEVLLKKYEYKNSRWLIYKIVFIFFTGICIYHSAFNLMDYKFKWLSYLMVIAWIAIIYIMIITYKLKNKNLKNIYTIREKLGKLIDFFSTWHEFMAKSEIKKFEIDLKLTLAEQIYLKTKYLEPKTPKEESASTKRLFEELEQWKKTLAKPSTSP